MRRERCLTRALIKRRCWYASCPAYSEAYTTTNDAYLMPCSASCVVSKNHTLLRFYSNVCDNRTISDSSSSTPLRSGFFLSNIFLLICFTRSDQSFSVSSQSQCFARNSTLTLWSCIEFFAVAYISWWTSPFLAIFEEFHADLLISCSSVTAAVLGLLKAVSSRPTKLWTSVGISE